MPKPLDSARHARPLAFFLETNGPEVPWILLNAFCYGCGQASLFVATYLLGVVVDILNSTTHGNLLPYLVAIVILLCGYEIGFRIGHIIEVLMISRVRSRIKKALFDHTSSLSFGYFADRFAGEISHKVAQLADAYERNIIITTNDLIEGGVVAVLSAISLGFIASAFGIYIMLWTACFITGILTLGKHMELRASIYAKEDAKTTGAFVDLYSNIAAYKVYGRAANRGAAHRQVDAELHSYRRLGLWSIFVYAFEGWAIVALGSGILVITALLYARGLITIGSIVFISSVALRLFGFTWDVGRNILEFIRRRGEIAQNLRELIVAPAILDGAHAQEKKHERVDIKYQNVTFGYSHERPVLNDFSLDIKAGEKLGIVGLSGAGKTTFANLLLRFFDVQKGAVLLNDRDIREFTQEYLRSHISYISQDTSLFHATIAENIAYGSSAASRADIERAARLAYTNEFIKDLPQGYESVVGERGIKLSGGQRQRIAVARAILADRPAFLLDEATSALDSDSEKKIQKALATLMEGKTVIAIAHRLSTLLHMDRIIYLEGGKILEDGTHEELLKLNGKYAALWHLQAGGFLPDSI